MQSIMYLCDGKVTECRKTNCYLDGGFCRHTSDISHAINFRLMQSGRYSEIAIEDKDAKASRSLKVIGNASLK